MHEALGSGFDPSTEKEKNKKKKKKKLAIFSASSLL
jgi:hypothetical protein